MTKSDLLILAEHSTRGMDMLRGMTFLEDSLEGILHHHERYDGRGYPDGLAHDDIPLISRIIAVADAFDSLTMDRPCREARDVSAAMLELRARAGSQFDPVIVEALARALDRHTWIPGVVDDEALLAMAGYFDHDDPEASDLYARLIADADACAAQPVRSRS